MCPRSRVNRKAAYRCAVIALTFWGAFLIGSDALGQPVPGGACKLVSERTTEVGCWIIAHQPLGPLPRAQTFWHLDVYPSRSAAEAAKGPHGTVVESLGKVWLLSIEDAGWRPSSGERVAEIGPLPIVGGKIIQHSTWKRFSFRA